MPITQNTRFEKITINAKGGILPRSLYGVYIENGTRKYLNIDFRGARSPSGSAATDLATVQAIYASSVGLLKADGTATPIRVEDTIAGEIENVDDLESYGVFNPLLAGSLERYQKKLRLSDGSVVSGGVPAIRHAAWGGYEDVPDILEKSREISGLGYAPDKSYVRLTNTNAAHAGIRIENSLADPTDCLFQANVSWIHRSQWGWFIGIATTFSGFSTYSWDSYRNGIVLRYEYDGHLYMLACGQTDGSEASHGATRARHCIPEGAGSWAIASGVDLFSLPAASDIPDARQRNAAIYIDPSARLSTVPYGIGIESFGKHLDLLWNGAHVARWTWDDNYLPFRAGQTRGTSYIFRGQGGNGWTVNGNVVYPGTRLYAYNLSAGRNSAAAPGRFV